MQAYLIGTNAIVLYGYGVGAIAGITTGKIFRYYYVPDATLVKTRDERVSWGKQY